MVSAKVLILVYWAILLSPAFGAKDQPGAIDLPDVPLVLYPGEQRILSIRGLLHYAPPVGGRVSVSRIGASRLLLRAHATGKSTIPIQFQPLEELNSDAPFTRSLEIWVQPPPRSISMTPGFHAASALLMQIPGIQAHWSDSNEPGNTGSLYITGVLRDRESAEKLALALALESQPKLIPSVSLESELAESATESLRQAIRTLPIAAGAKLEIQLLGGLPVLRGTFGSSEERVLLKKSLRQTFPYFLDQTELTNQKGATVHFKVYLLEVERTHALQVGLKLPAESAINQLTPQGGTLTPWELRMEHLEKSGDIEILSSPELAMITPGEGEVFSGGEIPLRNQGRFFSQVQWKPYGLSLKIKTLSAGLNQIRFEIYSEVSHLDPATGSDGVPGLRTNRLKSEVLAYFGEPLLLTGLVQRQASLAQDGLPLLSRIPLLGLLFGNAQKSAENREILVSVLAHPAPPPPPQKLLESGLPISPPSLRWLTQGDL